MIDVHTAGLTSVQIEKQLLTAETVQRAFSRYHFSSAGLERES